MNGYQRFVDVSAHQLSAAWRDAALRELLDGMAGWLASGEDEMVNKTEKLAAGSSRVAPPVRTVPIVRRRAARLERSARRIRKVCEVTRPR